MNGYAMSVAFLIVLFGWAAIVTIGQRDERDRRGLPARQKKPRMTASERTRRMRAIQKGLEAAGHEVGIYDAQTGEVYLLGEDTKPGGTHREQEEERRYGKPGR